MYRSRIAVCFTLLIAAGNVAACSGSDGGGGVGGGTAEPVLALTGMTEPEMCQYVAERYPVSTAPAVVGSDPNTCTPGTLTPEGVDQYRKRIDFYRGWYGLAPTQDPDPALAVGAQECAAMMGVAQKNSHFPEADWPCYTEAGAETAGKSNLVVGYGSPARSVDVFMFDFGNEDDPGHRRWILHPPNRALGYGWFDGGPKANGGNMTGSCLIAFWGYNPGVSSRTEKPIAYPPPGAFPVAFAYIDRYSTDYRVPWTLSWDGASFEGATLSLTDANTQQPIPLELPMAQLGANVGTNAAGWLPQPAPVLGDRWSVRIEGVLLDGEPQLPITYDVEFVGCGLDDILD